jgi:hypothetical protein
MSLTQIHGAVTFLAYLHDSTHCKRWPLHNMIMHNTPPHGQITWPSRLTLHLVAFSPHHLLVLVIVDPLENKTVQHGDDIGNARLVLFRVPQTECNRQRGCRGEYSILCALQHLTPHTHAQNAHEHTHEHATSMPDANHLLDTLSPDSARSK